MAADNPLSQLTFRCYKPMDEGLGATAKIELQTDSPWAGWLAHLKEEDARLAAQPIEEKATLVPRKPNWDLKRDSAKKVDKLEKATQRAIADIIRRKIASASSSGAGAGAGAAALANGPAGPAGGAAGGSSAAGQPFAAAGAGAGAGRGGAAGAAAGGAGGAAAGSAAGLEERAEGIDSAALARAMEGMEAIGRGGAGRGGRGGGGGAGREELDDDDDEEGTGGARASHGGRGQAAPAVRPSEGGRRRYDSDEDD